MSDGARICLGAFAGAHGVKGEALVKTFTEAPENIAAYGPVSSEDKSRTFRLKFLRQTKPGIALVRAPEIASREDALALKGVRLYVARDVLPEPDEDEFYMDDLIGLAVVDEAGNAAGMVGAVHNFGAGDLIEIVQAPQAKGPRVIEFTKAHFPKVDLAAGCITIADSVLAAEPAAMIDDATGEIVSPDINVDFDAMREEDS